MAFAQEEPDAAAQSRFHLGPLGFTPTITLSNLGVDNNVFNAPTDEQSDTTGTITPAARLAMNAGRSRLTGTVSGSYVYYNRFASQRSLNSTDELRWDVPLARLTPFVTGSYSNTKTQIGYEIGTRPRLTTQSVGTGTELRLSGKTSIVVAGARSQTQFDSREEFDGVNLATALNYTSNSEQVQLRYKLTSLTTFALAAEALQDRFTGDRLRNSNSFRILPTFEMKPAALISGAVSVGFRRFAPLDPAVPSYQGVIAAVDAKMINGSRQFAAKVARDVVYSFDELQPYYVLTNVQVSVTQRITYTWDVVGRAGRQTLDYGAVSLPAPALSPAGGGPDGVSPAARVDHGLQLGAGLGYLIGRTIRVGFDANYYRIRSASVFGSNYQGMRLGASFSYGLQQ